MRLKVFFLIMAAWIGSVQTAAADQQITVRHFDNGKYYDVNPRKFNRFDIIVDEMLYAADDIMHRQVSDAMVAAVRQKREGVEIILSEDREVAAFGRTIIIRKMLVPLCPQRTCVDEPAVIYVGRDEYFSPAYINSGGGAYLDQLRELIYKE